jgi:hypothetical protein
MVMKPRMVTWAGHAARMGVMRNKYKIVVGKSERDHLAEPGVDGRVILRSVLRN